MQEAISVARKWPVDPDVKQSRKSDLTMYEDVRTSTFSHGLASNRRKAIIWTSGDPVHWHIYVAIADEFNKQVSQMLAPFAAHHEPVGDQNGAAKCVIWFWT